MSDDDSRIIKLKSKDEKVFEIPVGAAMVCDFVKDALEGDDDDDDNDEAPTIDVLRASSPELEKIVEYLKKNQEEPMNEIVTPLTGSSFNEIMTQVWYQDFVSEANMDRDMLFAVLTAANYMGIKPLLDLTCLKVTFMLTGKDAEEIRQILKLPKLTAEEEEQARRDHAWIFEDNSN